MRPDFCPVIKGWTKLGEALDRVEQIVGSRARAEQEMCKYLRAEDLPAKYWRKPPGHWEKVDSTYWTLENLRRVRSVGGVEQGGARNFYHVRTSGLEDLIKRLETSSETKPRIDYDKLWEHIRTLHDQGLLPESDFMAVVEPWIRERFSPPAYLSRALQDYKKALYSGATERPKSTNRTARHRRRKERKSKAKSTRLD
jgi:hypothetical protein